MRAPMVGEHKRGRLMSRCKETPSVCTENIDVYNEKEIAKYLMEIKQYVTA